MGDRETHYGRAPLRQTIERVARFLDALAESVARNEPNVLEQHLIGVARERKQEGYAVMELHGIVHITEEHVRAAIQRDVTDDVERTGLLALLDAVTDTARMVLSVRYVLSTRQL